MRLPQEGGHLEVLAVGSLRMDFHGDDRSLRLSAARGGHLGVLHWIRAKMAAHGTKGTCIACSRGRAFRGVAVGSFEWLSVERPNFLVCGTEWTFGSAGVGSCKRMSMECRYMYGCSRRRTFRSILQWARVEWLSRGMKTTCSSAAQRRTFRSSSVGSYEWLLPGMKKLARMLHKEGIWKY